MSDNKMSEYKEPDVKKALILCHASPLNEDLSGHWLKPFIDNIQVDKFNNCPTTYETVDIRGIEYEQFSVPDRFGVQIPKIKKTHIKHHVANAWSHKFVSKHKGEFDVIYMPDCSGIWWNSVDVMRMIKDAPKGIWEGVTDKERKQTEEYMVMSAKLSAVLIIWNILSMLKPNGWLFLSKTMGLHDYLREYFSNSFENVEEVEGSIAYTRNLFFGESHPIIQIQNKRKPKAPPMSKAPNRRPTPFLPIKDDEKKYEKGDEEKYAHIIKNQQLIKDINETVSALKAANVPDDQIQLVISESIGFEKLTDLTNQESKLDGSSACTIS